jgi:hypothetical protein
MSAFRALVLLASALAVALSASVPHEAGAAVMCQKKKAVRLRNDVCKAKEQTVFSTGAVGDLSGQVATVRTHLGLECPGDPQRRLLTVTRDVSGSLGMIGYVAGPLCRTLDDDPVACGQSFELASYGASACVLVRGKCVPCDVLLEVGSVCRNVCQPAVTCPADASRTTLLLDCSDATTAAACGAAWSATFSYAIPTDVVRGVSCFWDIAAMPARCDRCDPEATSMGKCGNTCIGPADLPRCRVGGRTFGSCDVLAGNPAACALTYQAGPYGTETCWYDAGPGQCEGCDPVAEAQGKCTNGC